MYYKIYTYPSLLLCPFYSITVYIYYFVDSGVPVQLSYADADAALTWFNDTYGAPSASIWSIAINAYDVVGVPPGSSSSDLLSDWLAESDRQRVFRETSAAVAVKWGV